MTWSSTSFTPDQGVRVMNRHVAMLAMLLCLFVKGAAQSLDVGTGSLSITAGVESTIIFGDGTKLVITGSADADVCSLPNLLRNL